MILHPAHDQVSTVGREGQGGRGLDGLVVIVDPLVGLTEDVWRVDHVRPEVTPWLGDSASYDPIVVSTGPVVLGVS